MEIRKAVPSDIDDAMRIYAKAREFMSKNGNPRQWGLTNYPSLELIKNDIDNEKLYLCINEGCTVGVFFYDFGAGTEPLYKKYAPKKDYGVVHRIASDGTVKGVGRFCLSWAVSKSKRLMIDTHPDNKVMQNLLSSLGFTYVGDINIPNDPDIRLTYLIDISS